ncbi:MAG: hypothetical protein IKI32_03380 [Lachnospiraceae bacterium]|nr:hypothetical protein [Lachnospiraceae bacterium]
MSKTKLAKRIGLILILMGLLLSLFALPSFADDTNGTSVIAETEENPDGDNAAATTGTTSGETAADASGAVDDSADDEAYWNHVKSIQQWVRGRHAGKYGMSPVYAQDIKEGTYEIEGSSNSAYFKIAKAELTVKDGQMTAKITIPSMSYLNVFMGTAKEAIAAKKSEWIDFKEVNNQTVFTIPVEALDKEIDCAAYSKARKKWYDRKIVLDASSLPEEALLIELPDYALIEDALKAYGIDSAKAAESINTLPDTGEEDPDADPDQVKDNAVLWEGTPVPVDINYPDGEFSIEVNMIGGSGRASISSPTWLFVRDGKAYARLLWSSAYYDYMIIGDQKFYNLTKDGGNSTFEIPIVVMDEAFPVIADTTAMGDPVEIRYELTFYSMTVGSKGKIPQEAAKKVLIIAAAILVVGFVLNLILKKKRKQ